MSNFSEKQIGLLLEVSALELRSLHELGPTFLIVHHFARTKQCAPGELIFAVFLFHRGRRLQIPLPISELLVMEFLARNRHLYLNATQIALGLRTDEFFRNHGKNAQTIKRLTRRFSPGSIKEHVHRLWSAFEKWFHSTGLHLSAQSVIVSKKTVGREHVYRAPRARRVGSRFQRFLTSCYLSGTDEQIERSGSEANLIRFVRQPSWFSYAHLRSDEETLGRAQT